MVLRLQPVIACLNAIEVETGYALQPPRCNIILTAADGHVYNQRLARDLTDFEHLVILCGHYKGFDDRISAYVHQKLSIGDYVLSGGELPALVLVDSIARLLPGVVSDFDSINSDSHWDGLLGAPSFTRPEVFEGQAVPQVLLSGNHQKITEYRFCESVKRTMQVRPDLMNGFSASPEQENWMKKAGLIKLATDGPAGGSGKKRQKE